MARDCIEQGMYFVLCDRLGEGGSEKNFSW